VLYYTLNVFDQVLQSWGPDLTLTNPYFVITMPDLAQTYGYQQGEAIQVQVKSTNIYGTSEWSGPILHAETLRVLPHQMAAPTRNTQTTQYQLVFNFVPLESPENGDSQILSYHAMWRAQGALEYEDVNLETSNWDQQTYMSIIDTLVTG